MQQMQGQALLQQGLPEDGLERAQKDMQGPLNLTEAPSSLGIASHHFKPPFENIKFHF
jgi:hypothetical protein